MIVRKMPTIAIAALLLSFTGCAAFKGHQVAEITDFPSKLATPDLRKRPSVRVITDEGASFADRIMELAESSNLFDAVLATYLVPSDVDYTIDIRYDIDYGDDFAWGFSAGTAFCIPMFKTDYINLRVKIRRSTGGKVIRRYKYRDYTKTWYHITLLFVSPFMHTSRIRTSVLDNMLKQFFIDLARDDILSSKPE